MRLIKNGHVLVNGEFQDVDVLFDETGILEIAEQIDKDCETIEAKGLYVLPGLIDVHVHLREPGHTQKETIRTGTKAAAHGGFTSIFAMPNVIPFPDNAETMKSYKARIEKESVVHTYPYACITEQEAGKQVVDMKTLKDQGVYWFSDDGVGVASTEQMKLAMQQAKNESVMIVAHTEDMAYRKPFACVHESAINTQKGWLGIPSECESEQLIRDLALTKKIGNAYHACHISAKQSVDALEKYKAEGADISAEVTAHHLLLEDKDVHGPNWKMNPPLRSHEDRMALIEGLERGALDMIASDHAPHTKEDKDKPMEKAAFGIVSLETSFSLLYTHFVKQEKRWSLPQLVNWMSTAPAKRFGLNRAGEIKVGNQSDFMIVDLDHKTRIDVSKFESMGKNTPFDGWEVYGTVRETIVSSKTVWKG